MSRPQADLSAPVSGVALIDMILVNFPLLLEQIDYHS